MKVRSKRTGTLLDAAGIALLAGRSQRQVRRWFASELLKPKTVRRNGRNVRVVDRSVVVGFCRRQGMKILEEVA